MRASTGCASTCSGAMYDGVPITTPGSVRPGSVWLASAPTCHRPRQAEVEQLHAVRREEDVRGLQVAVHQAPRVHGLERARARRARSGRPPATAARPRFRRSASDFAFEPLHGDEELAVVLADFVDVADVRMAERRRRHRASRQNRSRDAAGVERLGPDHLDRHGPVEPVEEIRPGDVIWFAPGEKHWHGATPTTAMTHTAIQEQLDGKAVDWMEQVSDEQYGRDVASTRR